MASSHRHGSRWSGLHELIACLRCRRDTLRQARIARSSLVVEGPAIPAVSKREQKKNDHGDDSHACPPTDADGLRRLGMEIDSARSFDRFALGTIICVHG